MNIWYSVLKIAACVLFIRFARRKSESGKSVFTITPFLVAWIAFLILAAILFVFIRFGMDHFIPDGGKSKTADRAKIDSLEVSGLADKFQQGKEIFQVKCSACHVTPERHVTDPLVFDNLFDRLPKPSEDYFIQFIKNSKALKASGEKYALKLADIRNSSYDHEFQDSFTNQDLEYLMIYIQVAVKEKRHE